LPGIFLFEGCSRVKYANDANFKLNMFLNWTHLLNNQNNNYQSKNTGSTKND